METAIDVKPLDRDRPAGAITVPLLLGLGSSALCYFAAGASLGLFFGGVIFATVLAPPLVLSHESIWRRAFAVAGVTDGVAIIWLVALFTSPMSFGQWCRCYLALIAVVFAISSLALFLRAVKIDAALSSAGAICAAMLWLTWPVWLSPWVGSTDGDRVVARLVLVHPIMAINGVLQFDFGVWSQFPIAYRLTNLGQDVAYQLPGSVMPAVLFHAILAGSFLLATRLIDRSRTRRC